MRTAVVAVGVVIVCAIGYRALILLNNDRSDNINIIGVWTAEDPIGVYKSLTFDFHPDGSVICGTLGFDDNSSKNNFSYYFDRETRLLSISDPVDRDPSAGFYVRYFSVELSDHNALILSDLHSDEERYEMKRSEDK